MTENTSPRAAAYIRVSQERNARNGYGLDAQQADIRRYAEYKGLGDIGIYREAGASGYERERPELDRLLADAKAGKFDVVIFPSIDRTARSVKDVIEIDATLKEAGVAVVFLREGIDTSTPVGEFFRNVMASLAQLEGRLIYERMSKGKRRKAAQGGYTGGWLPYGYRLESGRATIVTEEARVVRRIFRWRAKDRTLAWICDHLNANGAKTQRNGKWHVSTVRRMLANRFYTGRAEFEGELIRAQHDAIVSDVLSQRVAAVNGRSE